MAQPVRIDIREFGGGIDPDQEDTAIHANAKVAYFPGVGPGGGYEYPKYGSTVCYVPYTLLTDYGGELYKDIIRQRITKHMTGGEYPIIELTGVIPEWTSAPIVPTSTTSLTLNWYKEDPSYDYNIYMSGIKDSGYQLETTVTGNPSANNTLLVTGLTSGEIYYFYITAVSSANIESPRSKVVGAKTL